MEPRNDWLDRPSLLRIAIVGGDASHISMDERARQTTAPPCAHGAPAPPMMKPHGINAAIEGTAGSGTTGNVYLREFAMKGWTERQLAGLISHKATHVAGAPGRPHDRDPPRR